MRVKMHVEFEFTILQFRILMRVKEKRLVLGKFPNTCSNKMSCALESRCFIFSKECPHKLLKIDNPESAQTRNAN